MNSKQTNNFFINSSLGGVSTAFLRQQPNKKTDYYQCLIYSLITCRVSAAEDVERLAEQLATIARQAYIAKCIDAVEKASQLIAALPTSEKLKNVAVYYEALCKKQRGNLENARQSLEQVSKGPIPQYRARALQNIGAMHHEQGQFSEALPFYLAAQKASVNCDVTTWVESQWMIAVIRSIHGDHRQSLNDLEKLFPLALKIGKYYPARYYDFLNSLAVELGEAGRIVEAQSAINIALASPFASAHPQWNETREEIEQKRDYPDPSRCFLDRSISESVATTDSDTSLSAKTERQAEEITAPQHKSAIETKPLREVAFHLFIESIFYQRALIHLNASKSIFPSGDAQSFLLRRLSRSLQPRAPPTSLI